MQIIKVQINFERITDFGEMCQILYASLTKNNFEHLHRFVKKLYVSSNASLDVNPIHNGNKGELKVNISYRSQLRPI